MQYRTFGRTGWSVSEIGYGMWGLAGWTGRDEDETRRGHAATRQWWEGPANAFEYTVEVQGSQAEDDGIVVFHQADRRLPGRHRRPRQPLHPARRPHRQP